MANHKSAIKRHRQSLKRRERNRSQKSTIRTAVKSVQEKLAGGDAKGAQEELRSTERLIAKAASKGILHPRTAARRVSRLATKVAASAKTK